MKKIGLAGTLLLFAFLGFAQDAKADAPQWTFSVPVKLKALLPGVHKASVVVEVRDAQGIVAASALREENIQGGELDEVMALELPLRAGRDASTASEYAVWLWLDGNQAPKFDHSDPDYRAKVGTELVYYFHQPLPPNQAAVTTPALKMTGLASVRPDSAAGDLAAGPSMVRDVDTQYTFVVPVDLDNIPNRVDSFKVAVSVKFPGAGIRILSGEVQRTFRSHFDGSVSVVVEPAASYIGNAESYKASLALCSGGSCVSPLDPGSNVWAGPQPGSSPHVVQEAGIASQQRYIEVPALSMTGNAGETDLHTSTASMRGIDGGSGSANEAFGKPAEEDEKADPAIKNAKDDTEANAVRNFKA